MFPVAVAVVIFIYQKGRGQLGRDALRSPGSPQKLFNSVKPGTIEGHTVMYQPQEEDGYYTFHEADRQDNAKEGFTACEHSHLIPKLR